MASRRPQKRIATLADLADLKPALCADLELVAAAFADDPRAYECTDFVYGHGPYANREMPEFVAVVKAARDSGAQLSCFSDAWVQALRALHRAGFAHVFNEAASDTANARAMQRAVCDYYRFAPVSLEQWGGYINFSLPRARTVADERAKYLHDTERYLRTLMLDVLRADKRMFAKYARTPPRAYSRDTDLSGASRVQQYLTEHARLCVVVDDDDDDATTIIEADWKAMREQASALQTKLAQALEDSALEDLNDDRPTRKRKHA